MGTPKQTATKATGKHSMQLLNTDDYHTALLRGIAKANKRIVLAAMILVWGDRTAPIFEALQRAAKRGVKITILLDNYTRLSGRYNAQQPRRIRSASVKRTFETLEELGGRGATIYCFGKLGLIPYKGRCHVKITIIDDTYYSFGGINLFDRCFEFSDYMLTGTDPKTADVLAELVERIGTSQPPLMDGEVVLNKTHTVLFDGGRQGHSLIYERACELAAQATQIHCMSQYTPSGQLARFLHETKHAAYFNRPEQMAAPDSWAQAFDQQRYHMLNAHTGSNYLHSKIMLFEFRGGKKAVLCGSHNFSYRGVAFGTQEIALYSTEPALWQQLYNFIQQATQGTSSALTPGQKR